MRPLVLLLALVLAGCDTAPRLQTVNVAVPIICAETVPPRPVMPTENLVGRPQLLEFVKAAQAEIERREGYEVKLRAALIECTRPIGDPLQ
jgi:hypothetical protein